MTGRQILILKGGWKGPSKPSAEQLHVTEERQNENDGEIKKMDLGRDGMCVLCHPTCPCVVSDDEHAADVGAHARRASLVGRLCADHPSPGRARTNSRLLSSGRRLSIWCRREWQIKKKIINSPLPNSGTNGLSCRLFHDDSLIIYWRRFTASACRACFVRSIVSNHPASLLGIFRHHLPTANQHVGQLRLSTH